MVASYKARNCGRYCGRGNSRATSPARSALRSMLRVFAPSDCRSAWCEAGGSEAGNCDAASVRLASTLACGGAKPWLRLRKALVGVERTEAHELGNDALLRRVPVEGRPCGCEEPAVGRRRNRSGIAVDAGDVEIRGGHGAQQHRRQQERIKEMLAVR